MLSRSFYMTGCLFSFTFAALFGELVTESNNESVSMSVDYAKICVKEDQNDKL